MFRHDLLGLGSLGMVRFGAVRRGVVWLASAVEVGLVESRCGAARTGLAVKVSCV